MYARDDVIPEPPVTPWEFLRPGETGRAIREPGASDDVAIENGGIKGEGGGKEKERERDREREAKPRNRQKRRRQ